MEICETFASDIFQGRQVREEFSSESNGYGIEFTNRSN